MNRRVLMVLTTLVFALLGWLKVRKIRGPQQTIESVKEIPAALTPGADKHASRPIIDAGSKPPSDPSGW